VIAFITIVLTQILFLPITLIAPDKTAKDGADTSKSRPSTPNGRKVAPFVSAGCCGQFLSSTRPLAGQLHFGSQQQAALLL